MSLFSDMNRFQKFKWIYIGTYFVLNLIVLVISYRVSHNVKVLLNMSQNISKMWYFPLLGILMFLGLILIYYVEIRQLNSTVTKKENEIHLLKSKLYDIEKPAQVSSAEEKKGQQGNK